MTKQLILGGARSGKSAEAERRCLATSKQLIYIATGAAGDGEMAERIAIHRSRRGAEWTLVEEQSQLLTTLQRFNSAEYCVLVDCLTLWLSNCLHFECWESESKALVDGLAALQCDVVLVSNEVGSGVVPLGQLSRQFVDESGRLHQQLAQICDGVSLVVAGLPVELK